MRMQRYDISLEYIPGRQLPIADTLSRAPCGTSSQATNTKEFVPCWSIKEDLKLSDTTLEELKSEALLAPGYQDLLTTIRCGWPSSKNRVPFEY